MKTRDFQSQENNKKRVINIWKKMKKEGINWSIRCQNFVRTKIFKDNRLNNNWQKVKLILIQLNILGIIHFSYVPNPGCFLWILQLMFHNWEPKEKSIYNQRPIGPSDLDLILIVVYWVMMKSMQIHHSISMIKWY